MGKKQWNRRRPAGLISRRERGVMTVLEERSVVGAGETRLKFRWESFWTEGDEKIRESS